MNRLVISSIVKALLTLICLSFAKENACGNLFCRISVSHLSFLNWQVRHRRLRSQRASPRPRCCREDAGPRFSNLLSSLQSCRLSANIDDILVRKQACISGSYLQAFFSFQKISRFPVKSNLTILNIDKNKN